MESSETKRKKAEEAMESYEIRRHKVNSLMSTTSVAMMPSVEEIEEFFSLMSFLPSTYIHMRIGTLPTPLMYIYTHAYFTIDRFYVNQIISIFLTHLRFLF